MKIRKSLFGLFSVGILIGSLAIGVSNSYADEVLQSPQNVSITTNNSASQATVSWEAPLNASNFQNLEYIVTESPDGQEFVTSDTTQTFDNLSIGQHSFAVKARGTNEDGPGQTVTQDFTYTGNVQTFTASYPGTYKLEVWGAQGGNDSFNGTVVNGGNGGYSTGEINLTQGNTLQIYVGQRGGNYNVSIFNAFNGGGKGGTTLNERYGGGGGGATDVRTSSSINNRIIVAGGGGGADGNAIDGRTGFLGSGTGGGLQSTSPSSSVSVATQTSGNQKGQGQDGGTNAGGGGGGYYGGYSNSAYGGSGGSGYIGGVTDGQTIAGNQNFKSPDGPNEKGHSGNGYARITFQVPSVESVPVTVNSEIFEANLNIDSITQSGTNVTTEWSIDSNYENVYYLITDNVSSQTFQTSETSYTFENLSRGPHIFTIKAFNENDQQISEVNENFEVNSKPTIPNITVKQSGFNQAKINWSVDDDGGSPITGYSLIIDNSDPISIDAGENNKTINVSTGSHDIKLSAINEIGESDYSTSSITIKQLPSQVQNLQVVKSSKTVTISWTPPSGYSTQSSGQGFMSSRSAFVTEGETNDGIEYIVESIPSGYSQTTDGTSVTFDLDEGDNTDYQFKVTPVMPFGEGIPNYTSLMSSSNNMGEVNIFVESTISLTLDDDTVDLSDIPGSTNVVTDDNEMSYTVTTNNLEGYTVTVKADQSALTSSIVGNVDNIPVNLITVSQADSQTGTGSDATALSSTNDNQLYSQNQRSVETGDSLTSTFNLTEMPWVNADDYTGTVTYTATAN